MGRTRREAKRRCVKMRLIVSWCVRQPPVWLWRDWLKRRPKRGPATEAAACGLRLIVPNHSAYTSYLDSSVASLISSREIAVNWTGDRDTAAFFEDARWWEPDENQAAAYIRAAIEGRDAGMPTAQARILDSFTWEKAVQRLREILSELDPPRKRFWLFSALRGFGVR